jgi:tRNA A37 threonylcarbamoyladenosine dehydratase
VLDINPEAVVTPQHVFLTPENVADHIPEGVDCAVDAIDDVDAKVSLLKELHARGVFTVSCMGAANRLDADGIRVSDIARTRECPLARVVRQRLRREGVETGILCVYFDTPRKADCEAAHKGSVAYVPPIIGLTAAGVVLRHLWGIA